MATFEDLMKNPSSLTDAQIMEMLSLLEVEKAKRTIGNSNINTKNADQKPQEIIPTLCPHCRSAKTVKCGKTSSGVQRYKCKECGKTFIIKTNSIFLKSRLDESQWKEIINGMVNRLSLSKIAREINVSVKTVWLNKHKIQAALQNIYSDQDTFVDIAECDECSVKMSFKGKRDPEFFIYKLGRMPRHNYSMTEKIEYLQKHGLWDELQNNPDYLDQLLHSDNYLQGTNKDRVSILSGKDRSGNLYIKPVCLGNVESRHVIQEFEGKFNGDAIIVTDSTNIYDEFAEMNNIRHEKLLAELHVNGPYSLARINSVHSNFREYWPKDGERGLATKYVDLGVAFFWWQEKCKDMTLFQQAEELWTCLQNKSLPQVTYIDLRYRPLPVDTKGIVQQYV